LVVSAVVAAVRSRSGQAVVSKFSAIGSGEMLAAVSTSASCSCWLSLSLSSAAEGEALALALALTAMTAPAFFIEGRPDRFFVRQCLSNSSRSSEFAALFIRWQVVLTVPGSMFSMEAISTDFRPAPKRRETIDARTAMSSSDPRTMMPRRRYAWWIWVVYLLERYT
jgi:hypothetical protein